MLKVILLPLSMVILSISAASQNTTLIGVEGALTHDIYKTIDRGNGLKPVPLISGLWGVNIRQHLTKQFFIESGLVRKYYNEGIGFKRIDGYGEGNAINAWYLPFRLGTQTNLFDDKVFITPVIGYVFCINSEYGYGDGGASGYTRNANGDMVNYQFTSVYKRKTFPLMQTGLALEIKVFKSAIFSASANYYTGFKNLIEQEISYTINNEPTQTGSAVSQGDNFSVGIGFKYPISKYWIKKSK